MGLFKKLGKGLKKAVRGASSAVSTPQRLAVRAVNKKARKKPFKLIDTKTKVKDNLKTMYKTNAVVAGAVAGGTLANKNKGAIKKSFASSRVAKDKYDSLQGQGKDVLDKLLGQASESINKSLGKIKIPTVPIEVDADQTSEKAIVQGAVGIGALLLLAKLLKII